MRDGPKRILSREQGVAALDGFKRHTSFLNYAYNAHCVEFTSLRPLPCAPLEATVAKKGL